MMLERADSLAPTKPMQPLPIDPLLPEIVASLRERPTLVLEAPPGAGKTTRVPRALLDAGLADAAGAGLSLGGEILVLEPRRLAARLAARRVAEELGESLGGTIGYQVRFEDVSSARTRIRFVTEGVLTRRLLASPELPRVSAVVLDEFHERHLQGDVALALLERLRRTSRPDLRLVAMSATLATEPLAAYLGAPILRAEGRRFDVAIEHLPAPGERPLASQVASAVRRLVIEGLDGDVLVFLPGAAEIRRARETCEKIAAEADLLVVPLHGDLSADEQDTAVRPGPRRKIILSTNVAESSVTIEGVVAVVDSGLARVASQAPWSGLPRLTVEKTSRASAVQRAGRAGRTRPGTCLRLYTRADFQARPEHDAPDIRRLDLAQTWLELAALRAFDVPWFEAPPPAQARAANDLLRQLGALSENGEATDIGCAMLRFAVHPRAARIVVEGERRGVAREACIAAAILAEGDPRAASRARFSERATFDRATERSDIVALVDLFREAEGSRFSAGLLQRIGLDPGATAAVARAAAQLGRSVDRKREAFAGEEEKALGHALLAGYPDRVAKRVRAGGRALALAGGGSAELAETSVVRDAEWLLALDAEERAPEANRSPAGSPTRPHRGGVVVRLASAIEPDWLLDGPEGHLNETRAVTWDAAAERVVARESITWDGLVIDSSETTRPAPALLEEATRVLCEAALAAGPTAFARPDALAALLARVRFAASVDPSIPAPGDDAVRAAMTVLCAGHTSFAELRAAGLLHALQASLGAAWEKVVRLAPERVTLAGGRSVPVRYDPGKPPGIASRMQDFFGMVDGPRIGSGRVPLVLELLAPNARAMQVTTDLAGFWKKHYPAIRKELMRRYPRHPYPEDPTKPLPPRPPRGS
jgi:ATP-dependent helicase HrpB